MSYDKFSILISPAVPLPIENVDTDQIIPARFLKAEEVKGKLAEGYDADICIWNPEEAFVVRAEDILHKHDCSPYTGKQLSGTTRETIVQGITVYQKKKIIHKNAGKWLLRK